MRNRTIRHLVALTAALVAFAMIGAGPASAVGETPSTIVGVGSDAMYRHGQQLDQLYNSTPGCNIIATPGTTQLFDYECLADSADTVTSENYTHDEAYSSYPLGGGSGVKQICQQGLANVRDADFARQTKAPSATDCTGTNFVAYGRDALTWEAFPGLTGSPAAKLNNSAGACDGGFCLTIDQLKGIFLTCTIDTWDDLGVASTADIAVYTAIPGAGTRTAWDAFLGGDSSTCIPAGEKTTHQTVETFNPGILANGDAKRAISLASFGTWNGKIKPYPDGSKLGKVDNVAPTKKTLVNGSFPFGRFIYNVYCTAACTNGGAASQATLDYVGEDGWLCKDSTEHSVEPFSGKNYRALIAQTITQGGFVPLPLGSTGGGAAGQSYCRLFPH